MKKLFDIILPTWNNPQYLNPCITSILNTNLLDGFGKIIVVNNGNQPCEKTFQHYRDKIDIVNPGENLGWTKGIAEGLKHSDADFVCFQNDDTFLPRSSRSFYYNLLLPFSDPNVAAVGPTTTVASGLQSVFNPNTPGQLQQVSYLIFFCVMIRRKALEEVGGIDTTLYGGDDFDLSIRFMKANKMMIINPDTFIIHHAFVTGNRVNGNHEVKGGWNSIEMIDTVNRDLIQRHGFKDYFKCISGFRYPQETIPTKDYEYELIKEYVGDAVNVAELGCGGKKVREDCIGVDTIKKGDRIPFLSNVISVADIQADVSKSVPLGTETQDAIVASHVLEHCIDLTSTLKEWSRILKKGGKLIIAVPDEERTSGIPLNPEHVHAFTKEGLTNLLSLFGYELISVVNPMENTSLVGVYKKL